MRIIVLIFTALFSICNLKSQGNNYSIRMSYNFTTIGKNGTLGIEKKLNANNLLEMHLRIHQNRQYRQWDTRDYWKQVYAYDAEFFGLGALCSRIIKIKGINATSMLSFGSQYTHAILRSQQLNLYAVIYDTLQKRDITYKYLELKNFKPMHILEQTAQFRMRSPVASIFSMDYSIGMAAAYE